MSHVYASFARVKAVTRWLTRQSPLMMALRFVIASATALEVGTVASVEPSVVTIVLSEVLISLFVRLKTAISPSAIPVSFMAVMLVVFANFSESTSSIAL